jgi:ubiquinol-cytochrome c reductase cytochrome b subunit
MISNAILSRFFIFHILIPLIISGLSVVHIIYLHTIFSSFILSFYVNNIISFYPYILYKDILGLYILEISYTLQLFIYTLLWHYDNHLEVSIIITPLHIVPEWYFLHLYLVLKLYIYKSSGLLMFLSITILLYLLILVLSLNVLNRLFITYNFNSSVLIINISYMFSLCISNYISAQTYKRY